MKERTGHCHHQRLWYLSNSLFKHYQILSNIIKHYLMLSQVHYLIFIVIPFFWLSFVLSFYQMSYLPYDNIQSAGMANDAIIFNYIKCNLFYTISKCNLIVLCTRCTLYSSWVLLMDIHWIFDSDFLAHTLQLASSKVLVKF